MSPRVESRWLYDIEANELEYTRSMLETVEFWSYVDSQATANTHLETDCQTSDHPIFGTRVTCSDWRHVRGNACMASASDRTRCGQGSYAGLPFCAFHFSSAWMAIRSVVSTERQAGIQLRVAGEVRRLREEVEIEAAQVLDARRLLAAEHRVYFFACGDVVKIGTSRNLAQRIKTLHTSKTPEGVDPRGGELVGAIPGSHYVENALHQRFRAHRVAGEWFTYEPIREEIAALIAAPLADTA